MEHKVSIIHSSGTSDFRELCCRYFLYINLRTDTAGTLLDSGQFCSGIIDFLCSHMAKLPGTEWQKAGQGHSNEDRVEVRVDRLIRGRLL